jgi:hypothetical protein
LNEIEYSSEFSHTVLHNFVYSLLNKNPLTSNEKKEVGKINEQNNVIQDNVAESKENPFKIEKEKSISAKDKEAQIYNSVEKENEKKVLNSNNVSNI